MASIQPYQFKSLANGEFDSQCNNSSSSEDENSEESDEEVNNRVAAGESQ